MTLTARDESPAKTDSSQRSTDFQISLPRWLVYSCFSMAGIFTTVAFVAPSLLTQTAAQFYKSTMGGGGPQGAQLGEIVSVSTAPTHGAHGVLGTMNDMLAGNPMWKDLRPGTIAAQEMRSFGLAYSNLPEEAKHVPVNHAAPSELNNLLVEYYHKVGVGGLMQAILDEGGQPLLQEIGHNVGMVVASQLKNRAELRDTLFVLATRTSPWRAAIHGVMWHYLQRLGLTGAQEQWDLVLSKDACGAFVDTSPYFYTSCIHGFGHGVYQQHVNDLPGALAVCGAIDDLHDGEDALQCATGVYMEYQAGVSQQAITKPQCSADEKYSRACFFRFYTTKVMNIRHLGDSDKEMLIEDFCHDVSDQNKHADCAYGFAKAVFPQTSGQSLRSFCLGRYNNPDSKSRFRVDLQAAVSCVYGATAMEARGYESEASPALKAPEAVIQRVVQSCRATFRDVTSASRDRRHLRSLNANEMELAGRLTEACIAGSQSLNSEHALANIAWKVNK